ncbi:ATP-binding cassette domain-containing protein [Actinotalea sp.]|uniref:ATP-binding cassette domain-containing protein n=1 Tax=Actinotalea sp. TaxID=1872145 RepID=UPI003564BCF3
MIRLRGITKAYGGQHVLDGLDLDLPDGRVTAVMGPNGVGKTTLARILLGLETPDAGTIDGLAGLSCAAVFQEDRLCGQLTAAGNVALVLERRTPPSAVHAELAAVGLDAESRAKPVRELSGGQRRRVVIVRALAADADLLVLDEPFKGLDATGRDLVMAHVRARSAGRTTLFITHDPGEAEQLGDQLIHLDPPTADVR